MGQEDVSPFVGRVDARFEGGADTRLSSVEKLRRAVERAGVTLIAENGGGAGVRLAKNDRPVKRKARN